MPGISCCAEEATRRLRRGVDERGYASIPAGSQTVGPYFRIGLEYLIERTPALNAGHARKIEISGRVLDRDGAPVPDAMLEFWSAGNEQRLSGTGSVPFPAGFRRVATDSDGKFSVVIAAPRQRCGWMMGACRRRICWCWCLHAGCFAT